MSRPPSPHSRRLATLTLRLFLPVATTIVALSLFFYLTGRAKEYTTNSDIESSAVQLGKWSITYLLEEDRKDLLHITQSFNRWYSKTSNSDTLIRSAGDDFLDYIASHPTYDQLRWIDESGMERIRVNSKEGHTVLVAPSELQNKSGRYYFEDARKLDFGKVYVSELDLNIENGKIEIPYKPVLRYSTPATECHGDRQGVIVLNRLGSDLINNFKTFTKASAGDVMLLNRDGFILSSPRTEDEWGFMLDRSDLTLAKRHPAAWQHISGQDKGQFLDDSGLWTFDTVYTDETFPQHTHWKILTHLKSEMVYPRSDVLGRWLLIIVFLLLALLFLLSRKHALTQIRNQLAENELRIAATAFEVNVGILITDANSVIERANKTFTEQSGYSLDELVGQTPRLFRSGHHDAAFYKAMWANIKRTGSWEGEIWDRRKSGEVYPKWMVITAVADTNGKIAHYVASQTDISERKAAENTIQNLAFFDPLTQLPNRRLLLDRLQHALTSNNRSGKFGAMLFIDLDNFKLVNDTYGHTTGDLLLQQSAQRLTACVREGDTVARLGGDEFVVMLEDLNTEALEAGTQAEIIGEKILAALNQNYQLGIIELHNTPSIGIALFDSRHQDIDGLFKQADIAMYEAKKSGRNRLIFFDPKMQESLDKRSALEGGLRSALKLQQLRLYYQVQVDESNHPMGVEALIRWAHPEHGVVSPAEFIHIAEETGLILPIGKWVLETACKQLVAWSTTPGFSHLIIAVNVSAQQFQQKDFTDQVLAILEHTGADPKKLKLELTESILISNFESIIAKMHILKAYGISFSLDDFGTGYSSLSYLRRLPLDQIKIDRSFVMNLETNDDDVALCAATISLAHTLKLKVVAEGVETEYQRHILSDVLRCNLIQGYLFGRPLPVEEFEKSLLRG